MVLFSPYQHDSLSSFDAFVQSDNNCKYWLQPTNETISDNRIGNDYDTRYDDQLHRNISIIENMESALEEDEIDIDEKEEYSKHTNKTRRCEPLHQSNEKSFPGYPYCHYNELSLLHTKNNSSSEANYQSTAIPIGECYESHNEIYRRDNNYEENNDVHSCNRLSFCAKLKQCYGCSSTRLSVQQGRIIVVFAAMIYGTNFATVKMLNNSADSLDDGRILLPVSCSTALRFTIAAMSVVVPIILSSLFTRKSKRFKNSSNCLDDKIETNDVHDPRESEESSDYLEQMHAILGGGEIGFWYCIGYIFQAWGLKSVDASKSAFYNALAVVVVPLLDYIILRKEMSRKVIASVLLAILGVCFMQEPSDVTGDQTKYISTLDSINMNHQSHDKTINPIFNSCSTLFSTIVHSFSIGDLFCLGQALFFGIGYWRLEYIAQRFPKYSLHLTVGQVLAIWIGSIAYCITDLGYVPSTHDVIGWILSCPFYYALALVWTGMGSTAFALYLETLAMKVISASELTIIMTSISIWGTIFAFIVLGEVLSLSSFFGGVFILSGCLLVTL